MCVGGGGGGLPIFGRNLGCHLEDALVPSIGEFENKFKSVFLDPDTGSRKCPYGYGAINRKSRNLHPKPSLSKTIKNYLPPPGPVPL